jgi:SPP1 gp7 family putative phage head morphogenesis protein
MTTFLRKPIPFKEAADWIRNKPTLSQEAFAKLLPDLKSRAFTIAGIRSFDVLEDIKQAIATIPEGAIWDDVKKDIAGRLLPEFVDPDADEAMQEKQQEAARRRAELLIRTHGFQAYQAANHEVMSRNTDALPYWQYLSMEDSRVRPAHSALNGIILPADSPFWKTHFPPWEWGCRCQVVPLTQADVDAVATRDAKLPEDQQRIMTPTQRRKLEQENVLVRKGNVFNVASAAERGQPGAFTFDPAGLKLPLASLKDRYSPEVWSVFESWARKAKTESGQTIWQWLSGKEAETQKIAPVPPVIITAPTPAPKETLTPEKARARISDIESTYRKEHDDVTKRVETLSTDLIKAFQKVSDIHKTSGYGTYPEIEAAKAERDRLDAERKLAVKQANALREKRTEEALRAISQTPAKFNMALVSKFPDSQAVAIRTATQTVRDFIGEGLFDSLTLEARKIRGNRSYYLGGSIHLSKHATKNVVAHEIGHWLEDVDKDLNAKAIAFRRARTEGETQVQLRKLTGNKGYRANEYTMKDRFRDPYAGKLYQMNKHTEIISMGLQWMIEDPVSFASEDADYFDFIFSLFTTKGGGK